jgi:L-alanine-DL-glutamate epimerase-like enolase superfamily enzyme
MILDGVTVRQVCFPLVQPYKLSTGDKVVFDPYLVEMRAGGVTGWGECMVSVGYTTESRSDSWQAAQDMARKMPGLRVDDARAKVAAYAERLPGICSAMYGALDMLDDNPMFKIGQDTHVPLLAPCQESEELALREEIAKLTEQGFKTLKVKVGFDWRKDLERVERIQAIAGGRASIRLDANRGFSENDGIAFASRLSPAGIELFEQPCASDDWDANASVAAKSTVSVMLDESIYGVDDIDRAARIANVGFVKLKLKKIGNVDQLAAALQRIRTLGLTPVLGDGVSLELACWMEACVAVHTIDNAGEMNGFLKARSRLLENPLGFERGAIYLPAGYRPRVDRESLAAHTVLEEAFGK